MPKPDVIVRAEHADWTGPSRGPPFWVGFQPEAGLAHPRLALGRWLAVQLIACVQPNVGILPLQTSRWIDGGTLWPAKRG